MTHVNFRNNSQETESRDAAQRCRGLTGARYQWANTHDKSPIAVLIAEYLRTLPPSDREYMLSKFSRQVDYMNTVTPQERRTCENDERRTFNVIEASTQTNSSVDLTDHLLEMRHKYCGHKPKGRFVKGCKVWDVLLKDPVNVMNHSIEVQMNSEMEINRYVPEFFDEEESGETVRRGLMGSETWDSFKRKWYAPAPTPPTRDSQYGSVKKVPEAPRKREGQTSSSSIGGGRTYKDFRRPTAAEKTPRVTTEEVESGRTSDDEPQTRLELCGCASVGSDISECTKRVAYRQYDPKNCRQCKTGGCASNESVVTRVWAAVPEYRDSSSFEKSTSWSQAERNRSREYDDDGEPARMVVLQVSDDPDRRKRYDPAPTRPTSDSRYGSANRVPKTPRGRERRSVAETTKTNRLRHMTRDWRRDFSRGDESESDGRLRQCTQKRHHHDRLFDVTVEKKRTRGRGRMS